MDVVSPKLSSSSRCTLPYNRFSSGVECTRFLQLLSAAVGLRSQWIASLPHILMLIFVVVVVVVVVVLFCFNLVKGTSEENMLRGLVFLTAWTVWRRH